jgi:hypothetical protein
VARRESGTTSFQVGLTTARDRGHEATASPTWSGSRRAAGATILRNWTITQKDGGLAMSTIGSTVAFDLGGDVTSTTSSMR